MSAPGAPETARFDGEGNLVEASARLADLNVRAGGQTGAPLAIPALARLVALVRSLKLPLSRTVFVADGDADAEMHVVVHPHDAGVILNIDAWRWRAMRPSWLIEAPAAPPARVGLPWRFATDARLVLTEFAAHPDDPGDLRPADLVGQPLTRLVRLIEDQAGDLNLLEAMAGGTGIRRQRAVRRDMPDIEYVLEGSTASDADGRFAGFRVVATPVDVEPDAPVSSGEGEFGERLGTVLRAPLDRIIARAEAIAAQSDGPLRRDYADYAGDIANAGRHLLGLVDDIADLQAVERPDFAVTTEPIDLSDVARRAAGLLSVRAADQGVRIDKPGATEMLMARGDFQRVLQILVNLLSNAIRYSPSGGMVWLRTEQDGDNVVIVVADQGKGIDSADHDRVFAKFERIDRSETGGSGLGLYISRRLARAMGGDITLDSAPGQGARFVLTLPAA